MQGIVTLRSRGQALVETAIALPVFLLALFGVVWALQSGVLGERVQLLARYGGMVSAQSNPYDGYSFYAAYRAAAGTPVVAPCPTPPAALIADGAPVAAPAQPTQPFWQAAATTTSATCSRAIASAAGLSAPKLLTRAQFAIAAQNDVPPLLQSALGSVSTWSASLNHFQSPDMGALIACYPELQSAFEASVAPAANPGGSPPAPPPLTYDTTPLALGGGC